MFPIPSVLRPGRAGLDPAAGPAIARVPGVVAVLALALATAPGAGEAQAPTGGAELHGVVLAEGTAEPLAAAVVTLVGTGRTEISDPDGSFHFGDVAPGRHALRVERLGYRPVVREVDVGSAAVRVEIRLETSPIAVEGVIVTGSLRERGAADALRPVNVVAGEELQRRMAETVAATLASEPGVTLTSMGPATGRPVIRGLGGDRVLVLEDGERVGDVSGSGPDHATGLNASSARRIEVVRGPAALLYGSNALGGVINVIRDEIPSAVSDDATGSATLQHRSANGGLGGGATARLRLADRVPMRVELAGRTAGDLRTPAGMLRNTHIDTWSASVAASRVTDRGYAGAAVRHHRNSYGIPGGFVGGHAEGVRVEMERWSAKARAVLERSVGPFESLEADGAYTWYRHEEIEPPDILGTLFGLRTLGGDVLARHGTWGPFASGAAGVRIGWEEFGFGGSLSTPDTRRTTVAGYVFEEVELDAVVLEGGLRWDWVRTSPFEEDPDADIGAIRERTFSAASASAGLLYRVGGGVSLGASVARAFRTPDVNELFSEGPHLAARSFEVGNPDLETEVGTGVDVFVRLNRDRLRAELTGFQNRIGGFVYPRETGDTSRVRLPVYQFRGEDARLTGFEGRVEGHLPADVALVSSVSYVRGTLTDADEPLPLIPPLQGHVRLEYERPSWLLGVEVDLAARQDRLGAFETPTAGYAVFGLDAGLRRTWGGRLHVVSVGLENVTDREYRNHLSRVKEIMPEAGRSLDVSYRVVF